MLELFGVMMCIVSIPVAFALAALIWYVLYRLVNHLLNKLGIIEL